MAIRAANNRPQIKEEAKDMIVEYNDELYRSCFSDDGKIEHYKMIDGEWVFVGCEEAFQ